MFLFIWIVMAFVCSAIAGSKGRSVVGWFVLGFLFSIFALLIVACLPALGRVVITEGGHRKVLDKPGVERKCPFCAEYIKAEATKCRFCGSNVKLADLKQSIRQRATS
jgi:hypothetical protein